MSSRRLKIAIKTHGHKSAAISNSIGAAGHEFVREGAADVLLIDFDPPYLPYRPIIDQLAGGGAKVILYPHSGGSPDLSYDGLWEPDERVTANLVTAPGHAEFLRRVGYPRPVHVIGWIYGDMKPFRAAAEVRHVLFAPMHPVGGGFMVDEFREDNTRVFEELIKGPWRLTVRLVGTLEANGLRRVDGVEYVDGRKSPETAEMDRVDAVVAANGTLPTIAISRGVPTVLYSQGVAALGLEGETLVPLKRPELYMDYIRYPFDAFDGPLDEIVHAAARSEAPLATWKRRFIGKPFKPLAFVELVERIVRDEVPPPKVDATRSFTTVGFADEMLERPDLLEAYAAVFDASDDATLVIWGVALDDGTLLEMAEQAVEAAGLDADRLPDILVLPLPWSPEVDGLLAERADAVLSEWPPIGRLGAVPRFGAADADALRAAA